MLTVAELRKYIYDTASFNKLFHEQEFENSDLQSAIDWAMEDAQSVEPFIVGFMPATLPKSILLDGSLARLFDSKAVAELRNQSNLAEQNIPIPVGENGLIYERLAAKYTQKFESKVNRFKIAYNIELGMQSASSPYLWDEDDFS